MIQRLYIKIVSQHSHFKLIRKADEHRILHMSDQISGQKTRLGEFLIFMKDKCSQIREEATYSLYIYLMDSKLVVPAEFFAELV